VTQATLPQRSFEAKAALPHVGTRGELQDAFRSAIAACRERVEQARLLVSDAVARLLGSFGGVRDVVRKQRSSLEEISLRLQRSGHGDFSSATIELIREFVEQVVRVSHESMRMIDYLHTTSGHVESIITYAEKIDQQARETRFLAINARIETQRAGDSGRTFKVVADEVKRLAKSSSELSVRIRDEVMNCRQSLQVSRQTAIGLAGHDMTTAIDSQGSIIGAVESVSEINTTLRETLVSLGAMVDQAVQALQFEDMVCQLLQDACRRLERLQGLASELVVEDHADQHSGEHLFRELEELSRVGALAQTSLAQGSVELF
jgi:hypothetical protein